MQALARDTKKSNFRAKVEEQCKKEKSRGSSFKTWEADWRKKSECSRKSLLIITLYTELLCARVVHQVTTMIRVHQKAECLMQKGALLYCASLLPF